MSTAPHRFLLLIAVLTACGRPAPLEDARRPSDRLSPVAAMSRVSTEGFERALEPRTFVFPEDHGPHPRFRLEWWYFVGHLEDAMGQRFGLQLTFFRQALTPNMEPRPSAWATAQFYLAHFALSDIDGGRFHSFERASRGALELAGARAAPFRVWLEDWTAESVSEDFLPLRLKAREGEVAVDLTVTSAKELVLQGEDGLSQKSPEPGNASYYYSYTRMPLSGTVRVGEEIWDVTGSGWLDREWSTSGLGDDLVGWDWFALQLDDGRELMFYQLRRRAGGVEELSHGVLVGADGSKRPLASGDVELQVLETWTSPRGGVYPAAWRLAMDGAFELRIAPLLADQELDVSFRYWEGAVAVEGTGSDDGEPVAGRGYVELVGYADP